ncbi:ATP-binding protein [Celerinatantimonas diazotrophica]|uniref:histidine kinase n=1 Tax=Celerinatantimonas diazotrophica TaxID=412034 RepID=A0A4R1K4X3_9GAMM|nr:sensor histidine kinase [Celerinatantimonas diazotrophica]TCK58793.1 two-component system cit operon sensor histidine kinase CitA [Celerinatantimonas diazotrophica]CAG9297425.1 Sensor histidine kinase DpiB [Celerinatantimonas diazotrophica]
MAIKLLSSLQTYIFQKLSFQRRVFFLLLAVVAAQLLLVAIFFHHSLSSSLEYQIKTKALIQAQEIASDPDFITLLKEKNIPKIQKDVARLQKITDADFIVVGNQKGIRLAHPEKYKIGLPMVGGDNIKALKYGTSYTTIKKGSLGLSIRGKAGIKLPNGKIIGVVSVGYLLDSVSYWLLFYSYPVIFALIVLMIFSSLGAWLLTHHIKQQMFDMEPEEIAMSLHLQKSILQSIYEGTIAVSRQGEILSVNTKALNTLGIPHPPEFLIGQPIEEYVTPCEFFLGANAFGKYESKTEELMQDELITCNGETLVANRVNIEDGDAHIGWVVSFRERNDFNALTSQISQIRQHNENLRVMSHEFANRLSVIGGLIQIGAYDQAISTIRQEAQQQQKLVDFIAKTFQSKVIAGLLLGKYTRAKELGLNLEFDPTCQLEQEPTCMTSNELAAILGNLLDNAFEATLKNPRSNKVITLLLTSSGEELVIEVADNGTGIAHDISETLFSKGVSSKNQPGHGIGLYLVHQYVTQAEGTILLDEAEPQGTIFSIFIPNKS